MRSGISKPFGQRFWDLFLAFRRALGEFLLVPTLIIAAFLALAFLTYALDSSRIDSLSPFRDFLRSHVFANSEATTGLLEAIAAGIITLTSITISLLLVAVQQSAGSMTGQVFDQFLRRSTNQIYFGYFVGLALFSLITLATVNEPFNPVFGASIAFCGTVIALYFLLLLLYTTIHQVRSEEIIEAIHGHTLAARERQTQFIEKTIAESRFEGGVSLPVASEKHGYVTRVNLDAISKELEATSGEAELLVPIGAFVAYKDVIAEVRAKDRPAAERLAAALRVAIELERERDITIDPVFGVVQLETIAWTSISTAKSNPAPGLSAIRCLRDIMSRWSEETVPSGNAASSIGVVYRDNAFERLLESFESLAVVASESMQHQNYIEIVRTFAVMFERIPDRHRPRAEDVISRMLSVLGDFALTFELEAALSQLGTTLEKAGSSAAAEQVRRAAESLSKSTGKLGSRATRAKG